MGLSFSFEPVQSRVVVRELLEVRPGNLAGQHHVVVGDVRLRVPRAVLKFHLQAATELPQIDFGPIQAEPDANLVCFIGTELHKAVFLPLLQAKQPADAKAYAAGLAEARLAIVDKHLIGREFLLDSFSVADAYLFTVLNWSGATKIDLAPWPAITSYMQRLQTRASIARALKEELALYKAEVARQQAA